MASPGTKTVMFGATIYLDPSEIAQADGMLLAAIEHKLGNPDVTVTVAQEVTRPRTWSLQPITEDTE